MTTICRARVQLTPRGIPACVLAPAPLVLCAPLRLPAAAPVRTLEASHTSRAPPSLPCRPVAPGAAPVAIERYAFQAVMRSPASARAVQERIAATRRAQVRAVRLQLSVREPA